MHTIREPAMMWVLATPVTLMSAKLLADAARAAGGMTPQLVMNPCTLSIITGAAIRAARMRVDRDLLETLLHAKIVEEMTVPDGVVYTT